MEEPIGLSGEIAPPSSRLSTTLPKRLSKRGENRVRFDEASLSVISLKEEDRRCSFTPEINPGPSSSLGVTRVRRVISLSGDHNNTAPHLPSRVQQKPRPMPRVISLQERNEMGLTENSTTNAHPNANVVVTNPARHQPIASEPGRTPSPSRKSLQDPKGRRASTSSVFQSQSLPRRSSRLSSGPTYASSGLDASEGTPYIRKARSKLSRSSTSLGIDSIWVGSAPHRFVVLQSFQHVAEANLRTIFSLYRATKARCEGAVTANGLHKVIAEIEDSGTQSEEAKALRSYALALAFQVQSPNSPLSLRAVLRIYYPDASDGELRFLADSESLIMDQVPRTPITDTEGGVAEAKEDDSERLLCYMTPEEGRLAKEVFQSLPKSDNGDVDVSILMKYLQAVHPELLQTNQIILQLKDAGVRRLQSTLSLDAFLRFTSLNLTSPFRISLERLHAHVRGGKAQAFSVIAQTLAQQHQAMIGSGSKSARIFTTVRKPSTGGASVHPTINPTVGTRTVFDLRPSSILSSSEPVREKSVARSKSSVVPLPSDTAGLPIIPITASSDGKRDNGTVRRSQVSPSFTSRPGANLRGRNESDPLSPLPKAPSCGPRLGGFRRLLRKIFSGKA